MILLQLPPQLVYKEEKARRVYELTKEYKGYRFAIELPHDSWIVKESIKMMERYDMLLLFRNPA